MFHKKLFKWNYNNFLSVGQHNHFHDMLFHLIKECFLFWMRCQIMWTIIYLSKVVNRYRIICTEYIVHIHLLVFIISDNCLLLETFCFYRTCLLSISDSLFISRIILFLQDNTVVPATPLFSAKILQEDKDMWLDVQVIILAALMSAVLSNSYLFVKDFYLYVYLFIWFQVKC